jgi:hypothetical protein
MGRQKQMAKFFGLRYWEPPPVPKLLTATKNDMRLIKDPKVQLGIGTGLFNVRDYGLHDPSIEASGNRLLNNLRQGRALATQITDQIDCMALWDNMPYAMIDLQFANMEAEAKKRMEHWQSMAYRLPALGAGAQVWIIDLDWLMHKNILLKNYRHAQMYKWLRKKGPKPPADVGAFIPTTGPRGAEAQYHPDDWFADLQKRRTAGTRPWEAYGATKEEYDLALQAQHAAKEAWMKTIQALAVEYRDMNPDFFGEVEPQHQGMIVEWTKSLPIRENLTPEEEIIELLAKGIITTHDVQLQELANKQKAAWAEKQKIAAAQPYVAPRTVTITYQPGNIRVSETWNWSWMKCAWIDQYGRDRGSSPRPTGDCGPLSQGQPL